MTPQFRPSHWAGAALLVVVPWAAGAQAPVAGAAWKYGYVDAMYGRHNQTFTIEAAAAGEAAVTESLTVEGAPPRQSSIDARASRFVLRSLAGGKTLIEFSPYAQPGTDGGPLPQWPPPTGYPTSYASYLEWTVSVRAVGWESISVPAGTFRALRVEVAGTRGSDPEIPWQAKQAGRFHYSAWYAPEVRRYVKLRHQSWAMTASPFGDEIVELLSFQPR